MENLKYNPVGWFEIYVQDLEKAKKFYEEVLQVTMQNMSMDMDEPDDQNTMLMAGFPITMEDIPGASGALVQMKDVPSGGNSTIVYFNSLDCAVEEGRVVAAGGTIHHSKMSIGEHGFIALCYDVDGNLFGLHSMK